MTHCGFIRDKLDTKLLVLYLMARLESPIDFAALTDLALCDEGVDYFMLSQAVSELVGSEHLTVENDLYAITDKGRKNGSACESSLPFSVRQRCDRNLTKLNAKLRQAAQIRTELLPREDGAYTVRMTLDDNQDNLMTLELYSPGQAQAEKLADAFQASPDRIYRSILTALQSPEVSEKQS